MHDTKLDNFELLKTTGSWHPLKWNLMDMRSSALAWAFLFLCLIITTAVASFSRDSLLQVKEARFQFKTQDIRASIQARMHDQEVALWGGVGLFNASSNVSRDEWHAYVASLRLADYLPGLQGYGYAEFVKHQDKTDHINRVRGEGFPDFDVRPVGARDAYSSIIYLEPFQDRNLRAFGYDMFSEPTRRAAMERARDTGKAAVSGMVTLVQETENDVQHGFLMYLPVYRSGMATDTIADRRAALQGFVYSPFRIRDLMHGILGKEDKDIDFRIFDQNNGSVDRLLYDSGKSDELVVEDKGMSLRGDTQLIIGGRPWVLEFRTRPGFVSSEEENQPFYIMAAGGLIGILLFLTVHSLTTRRRQALLIAQRMTGELRLAKEDAERAAANEITLRTLAEDSNAKLKVANDGLLNFTSIAAHDLRAPLKRVESFVSILREEYMSEFDDAGRDILVRIERGSSRMRLLLDSLHDYAKYSDVSIKGSTAGISDVIQNTIELLDAELADAKFTIDIAQPFKVQGNAMLLEQVFQNLVRNSIKFRGDDIPDIVISVRDLDEKMIELTITDNGIGIEPQFAEKVFDMFARLHNEDEFPGTGIGLAICKKIIIDHGGHIRIDTEQLVGTRMVVTLQKSVDTANAATENLAA